LYRLVLERAPGSQRYHAVGEQRVPFRAIAEAIGTGLGLPVVLVGTSESAGHFGFLGGFAATHLAASNDCTRAATGWKPREAGLLKDIATAGYFQGKPFHPVNGKVQPFDLKRFSKVSTSGHFSLSGCRP